MNLRNKTVFTHGLNPFGVAVPVVMDILDKLLRANRVDATICKREFNLRSNCRMFSK